MKLDKRKKDILLAGAIGDAIGYFIEFKKLHSIRELYGENGLTVKELHPKTELVVSDDTQMTLFGLEAILEDRVTEEDLFLKFKDWYLTQYNPKKQTIDSTLGNFYCMQEQRAPGGTCLSALARNYIPIDGGEFLNNSKGCGGVMRAAPFGFYEDIEYAAKMGGLQAHITHRHPTGYICAAFMSALINYGLYENADIFEAVEACYSLIESIYGAEACEETFDIVNSAVKIACTSLHSTKMMRQDIIKTIGEGWIGEEALAIAIYSVIVSYTFEDAIDISINHSGDSDSTGTLAAQLWVAFNDLPDEYQSWVERLDIKTAFKYMVG